MSSPSADSVPHVLPGGADGAPSAARSIEEFAAALSASLAVQAPAAPTDAAETGLRTVRSSFRERGRQRAGSADLLIFRVSGELFAVELITSEEAMDTPTLHRLPEMPAGMLGVFTLRGALVSVFAPQGILGVAVREASTIVVFSGQERRIALAVDDVDDVLNVNLRTVHDAPGTDASDGALLGVVHRGAQLIGILDADALLASFRAAVAVVDEDPKGNA